jgi:autotransporter-associated beta strand protein
MNGSAVGAGGSSPAGTWNSIDPTWNNSAAGTGTSVVWVQNSTAVFSAGTAATGPFTVAISGTQSVAGINFEEGTVTLAPAAGGGGLTLVAPGGSINVASDLSATISTVIGGSVGLNKTGLGTLTLTGVNTYTGATTIEGTLSLTNSGAISSSGLTTINANGTLSVNGGAYNATGNLTVNGGLFDFLNGGFGNVSGRTITIQNGGRLRSAVSLTFIGETFIISGAGSELAASVATRNISFNNTQVSVSSGGSMTWNNVNIGTGGTSVVTVDGAASTYTASATTIGNTGGTGTLSFTNGVIGSLGAVGIASLAARARAS